MSSSHDTKDFQTRSYRFSGYRLERDSNNNIIRSNHKNYEPEYILNGMDDNDKKEASEIIQSLELWFDKFIINV